ncbi:hypothetical protein [Nostoc sp. MS1]|uniref:hypothetical protein n=1 Tax=Nostoc sp. MS1 TaxID=2764711 RepID=UPI001CC6E3F5|nr:hypothetical protein [Nostoc sp. MS1]BCL38404.1 hypothetical protein NSMS1_48510 [Nostoc sp. MS1]
MILLQAKIEKQIEEKLLSYLAKELSFKLGNFFTDSLLLPFWDLLEEKLEIELGNEWEILSNVLWYDKILNPQNEFEPSVAEIYNCFSS